MTKRIQTKAWALLGLAFLAFILLFAPTTPAAEKVYKARLSYHWGVKRYPAVMTEKFAAECNKAAKGRLKIEVFPRGKLYGMGRIIPALRQSQVEMGCVLGIQFLREDSNLYINGMQRFFKNFKQKRDFWEKTLLGRKYWDGLQKKLGIKVLCYVPVGPSCYFSSKGPLNSLAAFKGLKARTPLPTERHTFRAMGVEFVDISIRDAYAALKSGKINTYNSVPSAAKAYSWWDFTKYALLPYPFYADAYLAVNLKWWDSIPQDLRDLMEKRIGPKISAQATTGVVNYANNILKDFKAKHGGTITTWSRAEVDKAVEMEKTLVWPMLARKVDPALYQAAKKFAGHE